MAVPSVVSRTHERQVPVTDCRQQLAHRVRLDERRVDRGYEQAATPGRSAAFSPAMTDDSCPLSASGFATKRTAVSLYFAPQRFVVWTSDDDDVGDAALE